MNSHPQAIQVQINGQIKTLVVRQAEIFLDTLRNAGLTGAKPGCKNGDCGSCTILVDNIPIQACQLFSMEVLNKNIMTIEGLVDQTVQKAFEQTWALQCGYCTPGYILNAYALLQHHPNADEKTMKQWLDSNICRCTGYQEIIDAVTLLIDRNESHEHHP